MENNLEKTLLELREGLESVNLTSKGKGFYEVVKDTLRNSKDYFNIESKDSNLKTFYFSMPESDGTFEISNGDEEDNGRPYYKIQFSERSSKGELSYISRGRDKRAINRYEAYLKPVCEIESLDNYMQLESSDKVVQIESGEVIHYGSRWVVNPDKKIKIKVEKDEN